MLIARRQFIRPVAIILAIAALFAVAAPRDADSQTAEQFGAINAYVVKLYREGKYVEGTDLAERALTLAEKALGREHVQTTAIANSLASLYMAQARYGEAEQLIKLVLDSFERQFGRDHPYTLTSLNNLAEVYYSEGRYDEAGPLLRRVLETRLRVLGEEHPDTLSSLNNLAELYKAMGRFGDAEPLYKRALAIRVRVLGADHPNTLANLGDLAVNYLEQGRLDQAEPLMKQVLESSERRLGKEHPDTLRAVNNLASLYSFQGRYDDAESLYRRGLEARERTFGKEHPAVGISLNNLGALYFEQGSWSRAAEMWRRSTALTVKRTQLQSQEAVYMRLGTSKNESERLDSQFRGLIKALYRIEPDGKSKESARETFAIAQWAQGSEAAQALTQMAVRGAKADAALSALVRERQDLVAEWQKLDALRTTWLGNTAVSRDAKVEENNLERLTAIDARVAEIDRRFKVEFPDFAALTSVAPLSVDEAQALLDPDEALVFFLDTPDWKPTLEETFIWVVTKTDLHWARVDLGTKALAREVSALRCGLDFLGAWRGPECATLTSVSLLEITLGQRPLPFDADRAYALFRSLFGPIEDLIRNKTHLVVVPSGPLTALPFQVLVTANPSAALPTADADYAKIEWLGQKKAITVLPSVSSLKALRRAAKPSAAPNPYVAFADPLLSGKDGNNRSAWEKQVCPKPGFGEHLRAALGRIPEPFAHFFRGAYANVEELKHQDPLPETTDEVCAVARSLGADTVESVYLGARATETRVKNLSASGALSKARVVHFATHGLLASESAAFSKSDQAEPALLLTPPDTASEEDDGLLTASEVAALKLDADWVILSACNTGAGGKLGGGALSGLARAFFYAGARALLVSYWYVDSATAVQLITRAVSALGANPGIGRAEAVRRAISAILEKGGRSAHPSNWAPFILVGEGGAGR
jgi:CHAT domain-containing protein/tetratricopeptide (TPR) repeat protein